MANEKPFDIAGFVVSRVCYSQVWLWYSLLNYSKAEAPVLSKFETTFVELWHSFLLNLDRSETNEKQFIEAIAAPVIVVWIRGLCCIAVVYIDTAALKTKIGLHICVMSALIAFNIS